MIDTTTPDSSQPHNYHKEHPSRGCISPIPRTEVSISRPDTLLLATVHPREVEEQQVELLPEEQVQLDQRQAVTDVAGGGAIVGIGSIAYGALRYLGDVTMTHILSRSAYGIFVTAFTAVTVIGFGAILGLDTALLRFLSVYRAQGEHGLAAGLLRFVLRGTLILGLLCGTVFFLSSGVLAHFVYHSDTYELPFKETALLIPLIPLQYVLASGLLAFKAVKWKVYVDRLIQPGLTLILMGVFYLLGLRLEGVILATIGGYLTSVIAGQVLLNKVARPLIRNTLPKFASKLWLRVALPMCLSVIVQNISNSVDVLSLAFFALPAQVGLYGAADRTGLLVLMPVLALYTIFAPLIAEYHARGEHEQLAKMLKVVTKWAFSLSFPMFLCFCVFHDPILSVFSREYTAASNVLIIVSLGNLTYAAAGPVFVLLIMVGRPSVVLTNIVVAIVINLALAFLLVPRFNIVGAAVAVAVSLIVLNGVSLVQVYWVMKMHPYRWDMLKPLGAGGIAAGVGFLLLHVLRLPAGQLGTLEALGLIIPFVLIYILVLALLRFSEEDMMVFDAMRTKLGNLARHKG